MFLSAVAILRRLRELTRTLRVFMSKADTSATFSGSKSNFQPLCVLYEYIQNNNVELKLREYIFAKIHLMY